MKLETRLGRRRSWLRGTLGALTALLTGCGSGTAGLLAGNGGGGGSSPTLAACSVQNPKASPATIELTASGSDGSTLQVELLYSLPGTVLQALTSLSGPGVSGNLVSLPASPGGTTTRVVWDFAAELGDGSFRPALRLIARPPGGAIPTTGDLTLGIGNDPPVLEEVLVPAQEASGNVPIDLRVSDSSSDVITIRAEWRRTDAPLEPWHPATAAGIFPQGIETRPADEGGVELTFFWNTGADLGDEEHDVRLRFTPDDRTVGPSGPVGIGEPREGAPFRVDNNEEPIVTIDSGFLVSNPDQRRGIPIPFQVFDEESDEVRVVFQWRRADGTFPDLPSDVDELAVLLADPDARRERHICTEFPTFVEGRVVALPGASDAVRLPELAADSAGILARGLEGRELELLRTDTFAPVTWGSSPLVRPVGAVPLGTGLTALVLDTAGGWRLREIALANGAVVREIAAGAGAPSALALEAGGEEAALVASDLGGVWRLERVELASGAVTQLHESGIGGEPAPVRAIASLGTQACVLTVGASLVHVDYRDPVATRAGTILAGLGTPSGLAVDPLSTNRIYLAERDAGASGRIRAVELDRRGPVTSVVAAPVLPATGFEHPEWIALEENGTRLLALCEIGAAHQLVRIDLGPEGGNALCALGPPVGGGAASLVTGSDGLRLAALSSSGALALSGGVEQRRTIVAYEPARQRVTTSAPFDPPARNGMGWRVSAGQPVRPAPGGSLSSFVWDSRDLPGGGAALLRAVPFDGERGTGSDAVSSKSVLPGLETSSVLADAFAPATVADIDGDGDLDLVTTNAAHALAISYQEAPGEFRAPVTVSTRDPVAVVAADLDGDRDLDLAFADASSNDVRIRFQTEPGSFARALVLGGPTLTPKPRDLAAADIDGDGDLDLVVTSEDGDSVLVFFQTAPGSFGSVPLHLGDSSVTTDPAGVVAADLDGDGDLDLATATERSGDLAVFLQRSPGSFAPAIVLGQDADYGASSVVAADLDGDGDLDLAVGGSLARYTLRIYFQQSPGSFGPSPLELGDFDNLHAPFSIAVADLDRDGDMDLAGINPFTKRMAVFFQEGAGHFDPQPLEFEALQGGTLTGVDLIAADLDGNGDVDLLAPGGELAVVYGESRGALAATPVIVGNAGPRTFAGFAAADLDSDGTLDLVSAGRSSLAVFFQSAPGTFSDAPLEVADASPTSPLSAVAAADLDGDGDLDLACAAPDTLLVFFQTGRRRFDPQPLVLGGPGTTDNPGALATGDLDGDGDLDLVSANALVNDLTVFFQTAPGAFAPGPRLAMGNGVARSVSVLAGDLDGDGDLDLVANRRNGNLEVFFQGAPGAFDSAPLVLVDGGDGCTLADLDGDGDLDLVGWSGGPFFGPATIRIFSQLAPGSFSAVPLVLQGFPTVESIRSVAAADLDGDGDLDLAGADNEGGHLAVYFQVRGSFDPAPLLLGDLSTLRPGPVLARDLDGDGDADLVSGNGLGDDITVFWGGR